MSDIDIVTWVVIALVFVLAISIMNLVLVHVFTKPCPMCRERIKRRAKKCRFCGERIAE